MAKDPAFLFYSGDFLTGVTGMNMEERGQYITLLCLQHAKGHLTLELINRSVPGLSSYVLEKFQQDEEGLYFNQRLEEEAIKRNKFCKSRSENRKGKENKDMINICETYDKHMENENEIVIVSKEGRVKLLEKRANVFRDEIFKHDYPKTMLEQFYLYWSEPNKSNTKMKFELQQTWDIKRRLKTWADRDKTLKPKTNERGFVR